MEEDGIECHLPHEQEIVGVGVKIVKHFGMCIRGDGQFLDLEARDVTLLLGALPNVAQDLVGTASEPHVIRHEQNRSESHQGVLYQDGTEQMKLLIHDVRWILTKIVLQDVALDGARVAEGGEGQLIYLGEAQIVNEEILRRQDSGEVLELQNNGGEFILQHIAND